MSARRDVLLIEGIGGIMVPLDDEHTVLDWMLVLQLPVILVAGSYLGTLSHTLTALDVLRRRGLTVTPWSSTRRKGPTCRSPTPSRPSPASPTRSSDGRAAQPRRHARSVRLRTILASCERQRPD